MRSLAVSSAVFLLLVACGGGGGAPPLQPDTAHDSGAPAESFAEVNPADLAELDAGAAPAKAPETSAPPSSGTISSTPDPKDDCTPVGIEFEKRARPKMKDCYATAKKKEPETSADQPVAVAATSACQISSQSVLSSVSS